MNLPHSPKRLLGILFLFFFFCLVSYLLGYATKVVQQPIPVPRTALSPTIHPTPGLEPLYFGGLTEPLRHFDALGYFFENFSYPSELRTIPNNAIARMTCTNINAGEMPRYKKDPNYSPALETLMNKARIITYCYSVDAPRIVEYETGSKAYFMKINEQATLEEVASISAVFMGCEPILLTKSQIVYYECHGGDTRSHAALYRVDLKKRISTLIYSCVSQDPGLTIRPSTCNSSSK